MKSQFAVCSVTCIAFQIIGIAQSVDIVQHLFGTTRNYAVVQKSSAVTTGQLYARKQSFAPTSAYQKASMYGFTILINPTVLMHQSETNAMRQELSSQLATIARVIPAKPLAQLRKVRIWVEWENRTGAAEFHPSAEWLRQHGYNPDKAGCVEVSNTRNFVQWSRTAQPWMLMHEFAHAYHHLTLGNANLDIQMAYHRAVNQKLYQSVNYILGGQRKAYALTDAKEYFAELSEAYFGQNDFYPFTRSQLKTYDPVGYQLMEKSWGKPRTG